MNFHKIDMTTYSRKAHYDHFRHLPNPHVRVPIGTALSEGSSDGK